MTTDDRLAPDVEIYLQRLLWALKPLPEPDRIQIALEIRGHLAERAAEGEGALYEAFRKLGPPHDFARAYVEDYELVGALNQAAPRGLLLAVLGRATRSAAAFVLGTGAALLYLFAAVFVLIALIKPFAPGHIGLWYGGGNAAIGFVDQPSAAHELLGLWIIPIALAAATACYVIATGLLRRGARRLLRKDRARTA